MAQIPQDIISHFEFFGYEIEPTEEENTVLARHQRYVNIFVKSYLDGILLQSYLRVNDKAKKKRFELLEAINNLNSNANIVTYILTGDKDIILRLDGIYLGAYDKKRFGLFLEAYNIDSLDRILKDESMKKFVD